MSAMYVVLLFHVVACVATYVFVHLDFTPLPGPLSVSLVVLPVTVAGLALVAPAPKPHKVMVVCTSVCLSLVQSIIITDNVASVPMIG